MGKDAAGISIASIPLTRILGEVTTATMEVPCLTLFLLHYLHYLHYYTTFCIGCPTLEDMIFFYQAK